MLAAGIDQKFGQHCIVGDGRHVEARPLEDHVVKLGVVRDLADVWIGHRGANGVEDFFER